MMIGAYRDGVALAGWRNMHRIAIRWREHPFDCELQSDGETKWLCLFAGTQLVWRERVASVYAACDRAREVARQLSAPVAQQA